MDRPAAAAAQRMHVSHQAPSKQGVAATSEQSVSEACFASASGHALAVKLPSCNQTGQVYHAIIPTSVFIRWLPAVARRSPKVGSSDHLEKLRKLRSTASPMMMLVGFLQASPSSPHQRGPPPSCCGPRQQGIACHHVPSRILSMATCPLQCVAKACPMSSVMPQVLAA